MIGDSIRWYDVFPNIDLKVRYIHDILKVDVIVKAELMRQIRAEVLDGKLNADDYLTARFDIPNVWVTGEARQGGEPCDLYTERLDMQQPVEFVKDGNSIQKIAPVKTYVIDNDSVIRSSQVWMLKKDNSGIAEMSSHLGDISKASEGDVVIDPSMTFLGVAKDTVLWNGLTTVNGGEKLLSWEKDDHLLFSFWNGTDWASGLVEPNEVISKVTLKLWITSSSVTDQKARAYIPTQMWVESANWFVYS